MSFAQAFSATIPVVNLRDFFDQDTKPAFIETVNQALRTVGFFAVINSDVSPAILDRAYAASKTYFSRPSEFKMRAHKPELSGARGLVPSERAQGQAAKDCKEFFHVARPYSQEIRDKYGYKENIDSHDPAFDAGNLDLMIEIDRFSGPLEAAMSACLGQAPDFLTSMTRHGDFLMRALYYPANPPPDTVWAAAHTDINMFTILPRATEKGLQVLGASGEWIDVSVPDGAIIVNCGDQLRNLSNGVFKSAVHRVVSKGTEARYSMVGFYHARPTDRLAPLPKFVREVGRVRYADVTQRELLQERLIDLGLSSPAMLRSFAESGAVERMRDVGQLSPRVLATLQGAGYYTEPAAAASSSATTAPDSSAKRARPSL